MRSIRRAGGWFRRSDDQTLKVWDLKTGGEVRTLAGHTASVYSCAIDPTGRWVASGAGDGGIRVWELESGNLYALLRVDGFVFGMASGSQ